MKKTSESRSSGNGRVVTGCGYGDCGGLDVFPSSSVVMDAAGAGESRGRCGTGHNNEHVGNSRFREEIESRLGSPHRAPEVLAAIRDWGGKFILPRTTTTTTKTATTTTRTTGTTPPTRTKHDKKPGQRQQHDHGGKKGDVEEDDNADDDEAAAISTIARLLSECRVATQADVLPGRGATSRDHPGNARYRNEVERLFESYHRSKKGQGPRKQDVVRQVLKVVEDAGGRFLSCSDYAGLYRVLDDREARIKIGQRFREGKKDVNKKRKGNDNLNKKGGEREKEVVVVATGGIIDNQQQPSARREHDGPPPLPPHVIDLIQDEEEGEGVHAVDEYQDEKSTRTSSSGCTSRTSGVLTTTDASQEVVFCQQQGSMEMEEEEDAIMSSALSSVVDLTTTEGEEDQTTTMTTSTSSTAKARRRKKRQPPPTTEAHHQPHHPRLNKRVRQLGKTIALLASSSHGGNQLPLVLPTPARIGGPDSSNTGAEGWFGGGGANGGGCGGGDGGRGGWRHHHQTNLPNLEWVSFDDVSTGPKKKEGEQEHGGGIKCTSGFLSSLLDDLGENTTEDQPSYQQQQGHEPQDETTFPTLPPYVAARPSVTACTGTAVLTGREVSTASSTGCCQLFTSISPETIAEIDTYVGTQLDVCRNGGATTISTTGGMDCGDDDFLSSSSCLRNDESTPPSSAFLKSMTTAPAETLHNEPTTGVHTPPRSDLFVFGSAGASRSIGEEQQEQSPIKFSFVGVGDDDKRGMPSSSSPSPSSTTFPMMSFFDNEYRSPSTNTYQEEEDDDAVLEDCYHFSGIIAGAHDDDDGDLSSLGTFTESEVDLMVN